MVVSMVLRERKDDVEIWGEEEDVRGTSGSFVDV